MVVCTGKAKPKSKTDVLFPLKYMQKQWCFCAVFKFN
jgi:hypothetical protein